MSSKSFIELIVDSTVIHDGKEYRVKNITGVDSLLCQNVEDDVYKHLKLSEISLTKDENERTYHKDLNEYSEEEWEIANSRFSHILPLLENKSYRTDNDYRQVAEGAGVGVATIYNWMRAFQKSGMLHSLVPDKVGKKKGVQLLSSDTEVIIKSVIDEYYLNKQRYSIPFVISEVKLRCRTANVTPPHSNTIRNRIKNLSRQVVVKSRQGVDVARDTFSPIRGNFPGANTPHAVVQIDHTPANIIVVDSEFRLPLGRPWITVGIDVYTRMVVGLYVSMEAPSALGVGLCISNALLPKESFLKERNVPGEWPVWGKMDKLHVDNAKEFRGKMLKNACQEYQIDLTLRPVMLPHYGGHIERLMGVSSEEFHTLPGTTFSNIQQRKGYDSDKKSALTLEELETHYIDFIVNVYHLKIHSSIGMPPIEKWKRAILGDDNNLGVGLPSFPNDPERIKLDFMPYFERSVQRYGIQIDQIFYYHESLNPWINYLDENDTKRKKKFIVRRDPRDLSKVYFYEPNSKTYYTIPYRNMAHPAINLWELREAKKRLKDIGDEAVDEDVIFEAIQRMRLKAEESVIKTKAARRAVARQKVTKFISKEHNIEDKRALNQIEDSQPVEDVQKESSIFDEEITAFDESSFLHIGVRND
jgi:putative transposase